VIGFLLAAAAVGVWAAGATVIVVRRDGYRSAPTRER